MSSPKKKNKKVRVSVIIPTFNQVENLAKLIKKLLLISSNDWEIIVIDDGSMDKTKNLIKNLPISYFRFDENHGPAKARNKGAQLAKGETLVFLDADTLPLGRNFSKVINKFKKDSHLQAVSGFWIVPRSENSFISQYKALRDWSYYFHEAADKGNYFFNTRVGMIKKTIFNKLGGFNTNYKKADLESFEFSFRLTKIASIDFNEEFVVQHSFKNPWTLIVNYFKRTYFFLILFDIYKQFGKVVATQKEVTSIITAALILVNVALYLLFSQAIYIYLFFLCILFYLYISRNFIIFFYTNKGLIFTLKSIFVNFFLHLVIISAVIVYVLQNPLGLFKMRDL